MKALKRAPSYLLSFTEAVSAQGRTATHRLLGFGHAPWREPLPYERGAALIGLDRLRLVDRIPTAIHRPILSAELADRVGYLTQLIEVAILPDDADAVAAPADGATAGAASPAHAAR